MFFLNTTFNFSLCLRLNFAKEDEILAMIWKEELSEIGRMRAGLFVCRSNSSKWFRITSFAALIVPFQHNTRRWCLFPLLADLYIMCAFFTFPFWTSLCCVDDH